MSGKYVPVDYVLVNFYKSRMYVIYEKVSNIIKVFIFYLKLIIILLTKII